MKIRKSRIAALGTLLILTACVGTRIPYSKNHPIVVQSTLKQAGIEDRRADFREIFCSLVLKDGLNSEAGCELWLPRFSDEPEPGPSHFRGWREPSADIVIVGGIFAECISNIATVFSDAAARMRERGYRITYAPVRGRAGSLTNAKIIRHHLLRLHEESPQRKFIILSYSKGTSDALEALVAYPEISEQVAALISVAGVVNGSPLADQLEKLYAGTLGKVNLRACPTTDEDEVTSITRSTRLTWLEKNSLPTATLYFSLVGAPSPDHVSSGLLPFYETLANIDPINDGQMIAYDAIVPGSVFLGLANADHFAIALPFELYRSSLLQKILENNQYPRIQMIEAAVQIVEQKLEQNKSAIFKKK